MIYSTAEEYYNSIPDSVFESLVGKKIPHKTPAEFLASFHKKTPDEFEDGFENGSFAEYVCDNFMLLIEALGHSKWSTSLMYSTPAPSLKLFHKVYKCLIALDFQKKVKFLADPDNIHLLLEVFHVARVVCPAIFEEFIGKPEEENQYTCVLVMVQWSWQILTGIITPEEYFCISWQQLNDFFPKNGALSHRWNNVCITFLGRFKHIMPFRKAMTSPDQQSYNEHIQQPSQCLNMCELMTLYSFLMRCDHFIIGFFEPALYRRTPSPTPTLITNLFNLVCDMASVTPVLALLVEVICGTFDEDALVYAVIYYSLLLLERSFKLWDKEKCLKYGTYFVHNPNFWIAVIEDMGPESDFPLFERRHELKNILYPVVWNLNEDEQVNITSQPHREHFDHWHGRENLVLQEFGFNQPSSLNVDSSTPNIVQVPSKTRVYFNASWLLTLNIVKSKPQYTYESIERILLGYLSLIYLTSMFTCDAHKAWSNNFRRFLKLLTKEYIDPFSMYAPLLELHKRNSFPYGMHDFIGMLDAKRSKGNYSVEECVQDARQSIEYRDLIAKNFCRHRAVGSGNGKFDLTLCSGDLNTDIVDNMLMVAVRGWHAACPHKCSKQAFYYEVSKYCFSLVKVANLPTCFVNFKTLKNAPTGTLRCIAKHYSLSMVLHEIPGSYPRLDNTLCRNGSSAWRLLMALSKEGRKKTYTESFKESVLDIIFCPLKVAWVLHHTLGHAAGDYESWIRNQNDEDCGFLADFVLKVSMKFLPTVEQFLDGTCTLHDLLDNVWPCYHFIREADLSGTEVCILKRSFENRLWNVCHRIAIRRTWYSPLEAGAIKTVVKRNIDECINRILSNARHADNKAKSEELKKKAAHVARQKAQALAEKKEEAKRAAEQEAVFRRRLAALNAGVAKREAEAKVRQSEAAAWRREQKRQEAALAATEQERDVKERKLALERERKAQWKESRKAASRMAMKTIKPMQMAKLSRKNLKHLDRPSSSSSDDTMSIASSMAASSGGVSVAPVLAPQKCMPRLTHHGNMRAVQRIAGVGSQKDLLQKQVQRVLSNPASKREVKYDKTTGEHTTVVYGEGLKLYVDQTGTVVKSLAADPAAPPLAIGEELSRLIEQRHIEAAVKKSLEDATA